MWIGDVDEAYCHLNHYRAFIIVMFFLILKQISTWISNNELTLNVLMVKNVDWVVCWFC